MISIQNAIVVEGKYDKIRLSNIFDCLIITTEGFSIFKDKNKQRMLKSLAQKNKLIVLTDSDSAGFMIRSFVCKIAGIENTINVYIPEIIGKEKRKSEPGKENLLGVEGIDDNIIIDAFKKAGALSQKQKNDDEITKLDLYSLGYIGLPDSSIKRKMLLKYLNLPQKMNTNSLIRILNQFICKTELERLSAAILKGDI